MVSLKSPYRVEFEVNFFLNFVFFQELSRTKLLFEHMIFGMILVSFSVIIVQIKIFSI